MRSPERPTSSPVAAASHPTLGAFAARVAHDVATPAGVILGQATISLESGDTAAMSRALVVIERQARRLVSLATRLREVVQRAGSAGEALSPHALCEHARGAMLEAARGRGVTITCQASELPPVWAHGPDVDAALCDLLAWGIDTYLMGGEVMLRALPCTREDHEGVSFEVCARTGVLLGEPGSGLATARLVATLYGGDLQVTGGGEQGATALLWLPR